MIYLILFGIPLDTHRFFRSLEAYFHSSERPRRKRCTTIERMSSKSSEETGKLSTLSCFPFNLVLACTWNRVRTRRERSSSFDKSTSTCPIAVKEATNKTHARETSYHYCQCANRRREREVDVLSLGEPHVVLRIWPRVTERAHTHTRTRTHTHTCMHTRFLEHSPEAHPRGAPLRH